jgi:preprotein translocase subunit SecY
MASAAEQLASNISLSSFAKATELKKRLWFTLGALILFRFLSYVPIPGIDPTAMASLFETQQGGVLDFFNTFSGGSLERMSIIALGVMPYITASIVVQLGASLYEPWKQLKKEGETGRKKLNQYTRYLTVLLTTVQGYWIAVGLESLGASQGIPAVVEPGMVFRIAATISLVGGTLFLMWIGEQITARGIGNGVSLIIFGGIIAGLPSLVGRGVLTGTGAAIGGLILLTIITVGVVALIVYFQEAQRRIPVQYARSTFRGGRMYRQQGQSHIPLRVNSAGMIPLIFAFSIMIFPPAVAQFIAETADVGWIRGVAQFFTTALTPTGLVYWVLVFLLVVAFAFFYTMVVFQQQNLAENLQRQGGFIPGIRPGRPTQEYIMRVLIRITWGGAIFLGGVAVLPFFATALTNVQALQISAAGLLIVVGVVIDTMRQVEAQMMMRNYEGFIS